MDITNSLINSNILPSINPPKRVRFENDDWIDKAPRSRLLERWKEQELYIDSLEIRLNQLQQSIESYEHLREKEAECTKLKSMLNYRLLTKTTQQQSLDQMRDMMQAPSSSRLRQTYLDPSINLIFGQIRDEIDQSRKVRDEAQNELQAWQFTPDSKTGKMLMARCKKLLEENEQLGKIASSDNVAKLEGEIALQNRLLSNIKDSQKDSEDIMLDMDTNMDTMSNTLLHMRHQLNDSHRKITLLNEENARLRTLCESNHKTNDSNSSANIDSTPNGTSYRDMSHVSTTTNKNKRPHSLDRTTSNKLRATNNLYDVDEATLPPIVSSSDEIVESVSMNSTNNNNQYSKRTVSLENKTETTC